MFCKVVDNRDVFSVIPENTNKKKDKSGCIFLFYKI